MAKKSTWVSWTSRDRISSPQTKAASGSRTRVVQYCYATLFADFQTAPLLFVLANGLQERACTLLNLLQVNSGTYDVLSIPALVHTWITKQRYSHHLIRAFWSYLICLQPNWLCLAHKWCLRCKEKKSPGSSHVNSKSEKRTSTTSSSHPRHIFQTLLIEPCILKMLYLSVRPQWFSFCILAVASSALRSYYCIHRKGIRFC